MSTATSRRRSPAEPLLALLRERAIADQPDPDAVMALLREAQAGNVQSFGRLYDLYIDLVYRYAYYRSGHREIAETVTAETFELVRRRILYACTRGESFAAWLLSLTQVQARAYTGNIDPFTTIRDLGTAETDSMLRVVQQLRPPQREGILLLSILHLDIPDIAFVMRRNAGQVTNLLLTSLMTLIEVCNQ